MPPDLSGGASVYVRDTGRSVVSSLIPVTTIDSSSASTSVSSASSFDSISTGPPAYQSIFPPSPPSSAPSSPVSIPILKSLDAKSLVKPILTPRSSSESVPVFDDEALSEKNVLDAVFPSSSPVHKLPAALVDLSDLSISWSGVVVENPVEGLRTLYVLGGSFEDVNVRETVCGVLELAEEELNCSGVVMCLEKKNPDLGQLLHSLMYVGGTISNGPFAHHHDYLLVGLDL